MFDSPDNVSVSNEGASCTVDMWLDKVELFLIMNGPSQLSTVGNQCGKPSTNERMSTLIKSDVKSRFSFHSENGSSVSLATFGSYVVVSNIADAIPILEKFFLADAIVMEVKWTENDCISYIFMGNPRIGVVCLDILMCPHIARDIRLINILQSTAIPKVMFSPMKAVYTLARDHNISVAKIFDFVDAHSVLGGDAGVALHGLADIFAVVANRSNGGLMGNNQWHMRPCSLQLMDYCAESIGYMCQLYYNMLKLVKDIGRLRDWELAFPLKLGSPVLCASAGSGCMNGASKALEDDDCTVSTISVDTGYDCGSSNHSPKESHARSNNACDKIDLDENDSNDATIRVAILFWADICTLRPENIRTLENYYGLVSFFDYWKSCNTEVMESSPVNVSLENILRHLIKLRKIVISPTGVVRYMFLKESGVVHGTKPIFPTDMSSNASIGSGSGGGRNIMTSSGSSELSADSNPWSGAPSTTASTQCLYTAPNEVSFQHRAGTAQHLNIKQSQGAQLQYRHSASPQFASATGKGPLGGGNTVGVSPNQYLLMLQQTRQEQLRRQNQFSGGIPRSSPQGLPVQSKSGIPPGHMYSNPDPNLRHNVAQVLGDNRNNPKAVPTRNEQLEANKNGVEVEYISMDVNPDTRTPVVCPVYSTISVGVRIRNTTRNMLFVLSRVMISDRSLFRCESRFPIPIRLNPMEEISLTCLCTPQQSGIFNNVYIFDFGAFSIGRYVTVRAVGNDLPAQRPLAVGDYSTVTPPLAAIPGTTPAGLYESLQNNAARNPGSCPGSTPKFPPNIEKVAEILKNGSRTVTEDNVIRELQAKGNHERSRVATGFQYLSKSCNDKETYSNSNVNQSVCGDDLDVDFVDEEWAKVVAKGSDAVDNKFSTLLNNMLAHFQGKSCTSATYRDYFRKLLWGVELLANQKLVQCSLLGKSFAFVKRNHNCDGATGGNIFDVIHNGEMDEEQTQFIIRLDFEDCDGSKSVASLHNYVGTTVTVEYSLPCERDIVGQKWSGFVNGVSRKNMYIVLKNANTVTDSESASSSFLSVYKSLQEEGGANISLNVYFKISRIFFQQALEALYKQTRGNISKPLLFPCGQLQFQTNVVPLYVFPPLNQAGCERAVSVGRDPYVMKGIALFNPSLNDNQVNAVAHIIEGSGRAVPYVVTGPPRSGKTCTLIESALQLLTLRPGTKVLLVGSNDESADDMMKNLVKYFTSEDLFRYMAPRVEISSGIVGGEPTYVVNCDDSCAIEKCLFDHVVPEELWDFCNCDSGRSDGKTPYLAPESTRLSCSVVVCSCADAGYFQKFHSANNAGAYDAVYIDDCEKVSEMEALVCFGGGLLAADGQLILLGDDSLPLSDVVRPPRLAGVLTNLLSAKLTHLSLLHRLLHTGDKHSPYNSNVDTFPLYGGYNPSIRTKLSIFYRSNPFLMALVNDLFYEQSLACGFNNNIHTLSIAGDSSIALPKFEQDMFLFPVVFHNVEQSELSNDNGDDACVHAGLDDIYNLAEVEAVLFYVNMLLLSSNIPSVGNSPITAAGVGVMCNSRAQVKRISSTLHTFASAYCEIFVGLPDDFSPKHPYRCLIVSPVVNEDATSDMLEEGLLTSGVECCSVHFNRMVCCSESLLVVVGCADVLFKHRYWASFLHYASCNSSLVGVPLSTTHNADGNGVDELGRVAFSSESSHAAGYEHSDNGGGLLLGSGSVSGPPATSLRNNSNSVASLCPPPGFGSSAVPGAPFAPLLSEIRGSGAPHSSPDLTNDVSYSMMSALLGNLDLDPS